MILKAKCPHSILHRPDAKDKLRYRTWELVTSQEFEITILAMIVLNMVQMAITHEGSSIVLNNIMDVTNMIFTTIFIVEGALKILAFGWNYFGTSWNKFDFFVVVASIMDVALFFVEESAAYQDGDRVVGNLSTTP